MTARFRLYYLGLALRPGVGWLARLEGHRCLKDLSGFAVRQRCVASAFLQDCAVILRLRHVRAFLARLNHPAVSADRADGCRQVLLLFQGQLSGCQMATLVRLLILVSALLFVRTSQARMPP